MNPKKSIFLLSLILLAALLVIPAVDQLYAAVQVPPPQLPGAPDQSTVWSGVLFFVTALVFGAWLLRTRRAKSQ